MKRSMFAVALVALGVGATLSLDASQVLVSPSQGGSVNQSGFRLESAIVKGQPYSAEIVSESVNTLSDGNRIVQRTTGRVFRDIDGRVRREDDRASGNSAITISDPVAGKTWTLDAATKTAREMTGGFLVARSVDQLLAQLNQVRFDPRGTVGATGGEVVSRGGGGGGAVQVTPRSAGAGGRGGAGAAGGGGVGGAVVRSGGAGNRVEEALPNKSIENLLCTGVRRTTTIPQGAIGNEQPIKIVSEEWTSMDLQVLVLTDVNDPRSGHSTYALSRVNRANPDPALFKVPGDYTIVAGGGRGRGGN